MTQFIDVELHLHDSDDSEKLFLLAVMFLTFIQCRDIIQCGEIIQ